MLKVSMAVEKLLKHDADKASLFIRHIKKIADDYGEFKSLEEEMLLTGELKLRGQVEFRVVPYEEEEFEVFANPLFINLVKSLGFKFADRGWIKAARDLKLVDL